jgi:hypothetical protein
MASIITREVSPKSGNIVASVYIVSKDPNDDLLARKYGDIIVTPSGEFRDSSDASFPPFIVDAGSPAGALLNILPNQQFTATFGDQTLPIEARLRQANIWTLAIAQQIANGITSLRTKTDSVSGTYTMTV